MYMYFYAYLAVSIAADRDPHPDMIDEITISGD
jgi:hypothetical protein